jgi:hypothetical protein
MKHRLASYVFGIALMLIHLAGQRVAAFAVRRRAGVQAALLGLDQSRPRRRLSLSSKTPATSFDDGDRPYAITTPIYYVNDKPHIGHAYTSTGEYERI